VKLLGALCILSGGAGGFLAFLAAERRELRTLWDLSQAVGLIQSGVRWKKVPVPRIIEELSERELSGVYFQKVTESLKSGFPLQSAWEKGFQDLSGECGAAIRTMEWSGDEKQVLGALEYLRLTISAQYERRREELQRKGRLSAAAALCLAGVLVVILA